MVTELLLSVNQSGVLADHLKISWTSWLSKRTGNNPIVIGILRVIGVAIASPSILGDIMEAALEAYFRQNGNYFFLITTIFQGCQKNLILFSNDFRFAYINYYYSY